MGYDVSLVINTGKSEHEVVNCGNYTYNVSEMYYNAFGGGGIYELDGAMCSDVFDKIKNALDTLKLNPAKYKQMNPKNGWGDYQGAVKFLEDIYLQCLEHPLCIIRVY